MKYFLTLLCGVFFSISAFAQPSNNECADLVDLGTAPICTSDIYTNVNATSSSTDPNQDPLCFNGGIVRNDVYFGFQVDASLVDLTITIEGTDLGPNGIPIENVQFAIYRGTCDALAELECVSSALGETAASLNALGLTPGITYYLRIDSYSNTGTPVWGDFTVCIEEFIPNINMGEEVFSSSCSGTIHDSGGPEGDYSSIENFVFTVCPDEFTQCIVFDVETFGIMEGGGDELVFYAGASINSPQVAALVGNSNGNDFIIEIESDCATLQFFSDFDGTSAGFTANWECSAEPCENTDFEDITEVGSIPYSNSNLTTCGEDANFNQTPCGSLPFLNGPETVLLYQSIGGICASIEVTGAEPGTGVLVLDGLPDNPDTRCLAQSPDGQLSAVDFQQPGDYYIIVANGSGCTDFGLNIVEDECIVPAALLNALCNPLNACVMEGELTSVLTFEQGAEDVLGLANAGCWLGNGAEPDYRWFTIEAQADGPFGFLMNGTNFASDVDINVWGPFTQDEVCETPNEVVNDITITVPIRSTWTGGTGQTGLADIHPDTGLPVTDAYDCGSPDTPGAGGDRVVQTIPAQEGEVYVVLMNDWGNNIEDGVITLDWSSSGPGVLELMETTAAVEDTAVCVGENVQLEIFSSITNIRWIGDNTDQLSCITCFDPIASPEVSEVYQAVLTTPCTQDTVDITVNVFDLDAGPDLQVCRGEQIEIPAGIDADLATYSWDPPAGIDLSCTDCSTPVITATEAGVFEIPVTLTTPVCDFMDMVTITVLDITAPEFTVIDDERICGGEERSLGGEDMAGNTYTWSSVPASDIENVANPTVQPSVTTTYYVAVTNGLCPTPSLDSVTISVTPLPIVEIAEDPDIICQGDTLSLSIVTAENDVEYSWNGPSEILSPNSSATIIVPVAAGNYTLTGVRDGCSASDVQFVDFTPILIDLQQPDTNFICVGESVQVSPIVVPSNAMIDWTPDNITVNNPLLMPQGYTFYTATVSVGNCVRVDSFAIQVDSLPADMSIMADPEKDPYCNGELVTLVSPTYEPANYPDITHEWFEVIGDQTSDTLYNMVINAIDTFTYRRQTINGGCVQIDTLQINVISSDALSVSPAQPVICIGDTVQLSVASPDNLEEITWTPADGLSCADCPDPIASPSNTTTYRVSSEIEGCAIEQSVTVAVVPPPSIAVISEQFICFETQETFVLNVGPIEPGVTYSWTGSDGFTSMEPDPEVTPTATTTYVLTASAGTCFSSDSVTINVISAASLTVGEPQIISDDNPAAMLTAEVDGNGVDASQIQWEFIDQNVGSGSVVNWEPTSDQFMSLPGFVVATLDTGCEELVDSILVQRLDFRVPNIFSPNNDGTNDIFKPFYRGDMDVVELTVYNRWGQEVFESNDNTNPGWDGRREDKDAPSDVYLWKVRVGLGGVIIDRQGQVTLVR